MTKRAKAKPQPWHPADYDDDVTRAIKALSAGKASDSQQQLALRWIVEDLAAAYDLSFRPGEAGDRETAFAEGKRFVGLQIVKQVKMRLGT